MIDVSNENVSRYFLLLKMAFKAKRRIALIQKALVDRTVRRMADGATLAQRLMFVDKWAALLRVTLEARLVFAQERKAAGLEFLLNICWRPFDRDPFVHFVAIRAAHLAFEHWVMMRQRECRADFQVTLKASLR